MSKLAVIDRDGWRKEFPLSKPITFIGSDPGDDIVLEAARGGGVNPRHVQLLLQGGASRIVTLGGALTISALTGPQAIPAYSSAPVNPGDSLRIGEFQISIILDGVGTPVTAASPAPAAVPILAPAATPATLATSAPAAGYAPIGSVGAAGATVAPASVAPAPVEAPSASIGVRLSLPGVPLAPNQPLEGVVTIRNQGGRPGAQFRLQVDGLDADCYEVGPGPMLFPNAEKDVFLRLMHPKRPQPPAGSLTVTVRVTAPEAYPGEIAGASQVITILPYYNQTLHMTAI
ncbi:MAG: hypothetical protein HZB53_17995 [Chloroflexi bacterium]|nr:hypothetical protein [Chloroflexota bacterium]